ncbi:hypothetical protein F0224_08390 [Vibrio coralliilyticus]|uniref:hypothetical protein n=1 Tax=Vibrio coralliilyticus TaxID=190893 RepID=UPI000BAC1508|nr:hypothetical protein [Vibrio coralliilyticus]NOI75695.1 hypothetical protein [Vibrio coralliilyticus]PAW04509.1 hypothetical protein CKJ79_07205 [Vibrio coralliilyticus]
MSDRLTSRRYQNSELRDKLASEYVLGTQTPRVRRRLETLMQADPTWWEHVEQWQQHLSGLNPSTKLGSSEHGLKRPPKRVWKNISEQTFSPSRGAKRIRWWWLPTGMALSLFVGVWLQPILLQSPLPIEAAQVQPVSYLAMMSSDTQKNHFALVAYQGDKPGQSSLRMQRNLNMDKVPMDRAMVWMRNSETGELQLIDSLQNVNDVRYMSPTEWQALKSSSELLVTANRDPESAVLYRGRCVELSSWQAI